MAGNTHRAIIEGVTPDQMTLIAGGTKVFCYEQLEKWIEKHPLEDGATAYVAHIVQHVTNDTQE